MDRSDRSKLNIVKRLICVTTALLTVLLLVGLRIVFLDSDASPRLSWSSGLLTDEGFYIHNARNLILFGTERTDGFNNMLLMPLLHQLQVGFFRCVGVGAVQARLLTVLLSLSALVLFFLAMRRAFGLRIACVATVLLGLDPVFVMYNRLALMDSPACLPLCAAFYAWTLRPRKTDEREGYEDRSHRARYRVVDSGALFATGIFLAISYNIRGLAIITAFAPLSVLMVPFWRKLSQRMWPKRSGNQSLESSDTQTLFGSGVPTLIAGMMVVLTIYAVTVWWPNRAELAHANQFYLHKQLVPHSLQTFSRNLIRAVYDANRGIFPFLCKHSPIIVLLIAVPWLPLIRMGRGGDATARMVAAIRSEANGDVNDNVAYLVGWAAVFLLFVTVVSYSPSRYYVLFYPPLAGLAAIGFDSLMSKWGSRTGQYLRAGVVCLWCLTIGYWYADWLGNLTYRQRDADRWLADNLPHNAILIGAVAPGLCLNNRLRCVTMIPELCNDDHPVERFATSSLSSVSAPCFIAILDRNPDIPLNVYEATVRPKPGSGAPIERGLAHILRADRWRERWWTRHYPSLVQPEHRLHAFHPLLRPFFTVGIYAVPTGGGQFWHDVSKDDLKNRLNNVN